nr:iron-containing alcohol dehydrogenase [Mucilaginibacter straminoryzae]
MLFGKGCLQSLAADLNAAGCKRLFVLSIEPLLDALSETLSQIESYGILTESYTGILQEPSFADFETVFEKARAFNPDTVVGIGGGSVLDVAKVIAAQLGNTQTLAEIAGINLLKGRSRQLICVPATAGTGSEVSPNSILINPEGQKVGIISPYLVPDAVYADPLLTLSVPKAITAATGIDALTHCIEAYTNKFAHPFIDALAIEGIRLIAQSLAEAVNNGANEEARTDVALGSLLGGFCLGPVNTAAVHALAYPLGTTYHMPHGLSNAIMLPFVMRFNVSASPEKYAKVALAVGAEPKATDLETALEGIRVIEQIIAKCDVQLGLQHAGVKQEDIAALAADALKIQRLLKNNPRPVSLEDAVEIYNDAY